MLKRNTSDAYPGANFVAADPVSGAECCLEQSIASMSAAAAAAGLAYIRRGGRLYIDATEAELEDLCSGLEPAPAAFSDDPLIEGITEEVTGAEFGSVEGRFLMKAQSTWSAPGTVVAQNIDLWADGQIDFVVVADGLPVAPAKIYGYVENACGRVNEAGLEGTYEVGAK